MLCLWGKSKEETELIYLVLLLKFPVLAVWLAFSFIGGRYVYKYTENFLFFEQ